MALYRHWEQASKIKELLQGGITDLAPFSSDEIYISDDEERIVPARGIHVVMSTPDTATGVNEKDDIRYTCLIVRVIKNDLQGNSEYQQSRSSFYTKVRLLFHRKRIEVHDNEIITRIRMGTLRDRRRFYAKGMDVSIIRVTTLIRETRG